MKYVTCEDGSSGETTRKNGSSANPVEILVASFQKGRTRLTVSSHYSIGVTANSVAKP